MHLGAFRKPSKFKRLPSSDISHLVCILRPVAEQAKSNVFPLRGFPCCMHLAAFHNAIKFKRLSLRASWGVSHSKQIQTPDAFPFRGFLSCVHLEAFRRASKFKRPSSSKFSILCASWGLSQSKQVQTPFFFEALHFVCILGPFAEQTRVQTPFLFEVSYFVCILGGFAEQGIPNVFLGPFAKQATSNVFPLRGLLFCVHLGAFRRFSSSRFPILCASWGLSQSKQIQTPFLFKDSYVVCILKPFAKQANSNAVTLRGFPCCVHPFAGQASSNVFPL